MNMQKSFLAAITLSSLFALTAVASLTIAPSTLKIGYINFDIAFAEEQEAKEYSSKLEEKEKKILAAEDKARTDIESKMLDFKNTESKLGEKAKQEKQVALSNEINLLQQKFNQERQSLIQERQTILTDLEQKNRLILNSLAKEEKLDIVLNSSAILYLSDELKKNDLSKKVSERYNKAYPVKKDDKKDKKDKAKK